MTPQARLDALNAGENPRAVVRLSSGWVEMAPVQFRRGYCLLLADPLVGQLGDLSPEDAQKFLADLDRLGRAVQRATGALRMNFAIYGNADPFLHAHAIPRFADEPESERTLPPLSLPLESRNHPRWSEEEHGALRERIRDGLA